MDVPEDATTRDGPGGQTVAVSVTDFNGTPIDDAAVVVHWNRDYIDPDDPNGTDGPPVIGVLVLRTGPDGRAFAEIPRDRYHIASAWAPGFMEEWTDTFSPNQGNGQGHALLLLPDHAGWRFNGTIPSQVIPDTDPAEKWWPEEVSWSDSSTESQLLADRFQSLTARLTWTLQTGDNVDLGIGYGESDDRADDTSDTDQQPLAGTYTETYRRTGDVFPEPTTFWIGAMAAEPIVTLDGVAYTLDINATFEHRQTAIADCGIMFGGSELIRYDLDPASLDEAADAGGGLIGAGGDSWVWAVAAILVTTGFFVAIILIARRGREK